MKVIVPFAVSEHSWALAATQLSLRQDGVEAQFEQMRGVEDYFTLFARHWEQGETFTIVEHDIVPWPGALQELENCSGLWCTLPYYCSVGWIRDGLGATKFSADLMKQFPNFLQAPFPDCCAHTRHYCGLDRLIAHRMMELGIEPHVHQPGVVNLNSKWT